MPLGWHGALSAESAGPERATTEVRTAAAGCSGLVQPKASNRARRRCNAPAERRQIQVRTRDLDVPVQRNGCIERAKSRVAACPQWPLYLAAGLAFSSVTASASV